MSCQSTSQQQFAMVSPSTVYFRSVSSRQFTASLSKGFCMSFLTFRAGVTDPEEYLAQNDLAGQFANDPAWRAWVRDYEVTVFESENGRGPVIEVHDPEIGKKCQSVALTVNN